MLSQGYGTASCASHNYVPDVRLGICRTRAGPFWSPFASLIKITALLVVSPLELYKLREIDGDEE